MTEARFLRPEIHVVAANEANDGLEIHFLGLEIHFLGPEIHFIGANEANDGLEIRFVGLEIRFVGLEIRFVGANQANDGPDDVTLGPVDRPRQRVAQIRDDVLRSCAPPCAALCTVVGRTPGIAGLGVARALLKEGVETA